MITTFFFLNGAKLLTALEKCQTRGWQIGGSQSVVSYFLRNEAYYGQQNENNKNVYASSSESDLPYELPRLPTICWLN